MSDLPTILPCPFCGSESYPHLYSVESAPFIKCSRCHAFGPAAVTPREAVVKWNIAPRLIEAQREHLQLPYDEPEVAEEPA